MTNPTAENITTSITPPPRWTTSPSDLDFTSPWSPDGSGTLLATQCSLTGPFTALMCTQPETTGELLQLFTDGTGKLYLWNQVSATIFEITKPASVGEVVAALEGEGGRVGGLGLRALEIGRGEGAV